MAFSFHFVSVSSSVSDTCKFDAHNITIFLPEFYFFHINENSTGLSSKALWKL